MDDRPERAVVVWDEDADEVEFVLEGRAGREGRAVLRDVYVRYDVDSGELLSIILLGVAQPPPNREDT